MRRKYIKMFENFQPESDEERYLMYIPSESGYIMQTGADSMEDVFEEDELQSAENPIRIWYQFDLDGFTLINKRIIKGPPNDPKYYEDSRFEHDLPNSDDSKEEMRADGHENDSTNKSEDGWFGSTAVDLRSE